MRNVIFPSILLVLLALSVTVSAPSEYDFRGYASSLDVTEIGITFNYTGGTCEAQMSSRNNFTTLSGSFDSTITWNSPDSTILGFSTLTGLSNTSCLSYGITALKPVNTDATSGYFESSWDVTHSADSGYINTMTRFVCESTEERTDFFISNGSDSRGNCIYGTRADTSNQRIAYLNTLTTSYNRCGDLTDWSASGDCVLSFGAVCTNCEKTAQYIYPFNSSATGDVIYNITDNEILIGASGQTVDISFTLDLVNTETQTITNLHTRRQNIANTVQNFNTAEGTLSLNPDTQYLLVFTFNTTKVGGVNYEFTSFGPTINLSIFTFRPDYVCGDFGPCINGSQSQVCVDSNGVAPDDIRTQTCFDVPFFINILGFEKTIGGFFPDDVYVCQRGWNTFNCPQVLNKTPVRYPENWTVSSTKDDNGIFRENYIEVTSKGGATEGTRALRMWYIPPRDEEPINDPANSTSTVCGNLTTGRRPFVTSPFNETLFISTNISFPAPFVQMRFDAKRCMEAPIQRDNTNTTWNLFCDGILPFGIPLERKKCYGECDEPPGGMYTVSMFDAQTLENVFIPQDLFAGSLWETQIINLADAGLEIDHNYTFVLQVHSDNLLEPGSDCVYFDNVQATLTERDQPCRTECDPDNPLNLITSTLQDSVCVSKVTTNSPVCAPDSATAECFGSLESCCLGTTFHFFDNQTGLWKEVEFSILCESVINKTITDTSITEPIQGQENILDFLFFLVSPLFIYFFITLVISATVAKFSENWELGGISFAFMVLVGSLIVVPGTTTTVIPIWVAIAMITIVALLISAKLRQFGFSGGGG